VGSLARGQVRTNTSLTNATGQKFALELFVSQPDGSMRPFAFMSDLDHSVATAQELFRNGLIAVTDKACLINQNIAASAIATGIVIAARMVCSVMICASSGASPPIWRAST